MYGGLGEQITLFGPIGADVRHTDHEIVDFGSKHYEVADVINQALRLILGPRPFQ